MKKLISLLTVLACSVCFFSGCSGSEKTSEPEGSVKDSAITDDWEVYSWTVDGETYYSKDAEDTSKIPSFYTEDGENFYLTITGENEYRGTIQENEDGTYELCNEGSEKTVHVVIEGNTLTLEYDSGANVVFVSDDSAE
ncbi:MAG: hypothetical protein J5883_03295 [Clostridiales bacterium]|nr:hypothetical protein [Clostridiales bacterium]